MARARDPQEGPRLRPHRPRAQAARHGALLRATGMSDDEILRRFEDSLYCNTIEADTKHALEEGALMSFSAKQRPGEPPSVDDARNLLNQLFFDLKRDHLTRVGRYKLNKRLGLDVDLETRTLTRTTSSRSSASWSTSRRSSHCPRRATRRRTTRPRPCSTARAGRRPSRRVRALRQPPPARTARRADPGGLPASASTGWSASSASASPPRTRTRSRRRRSSTPPGRGGPGVLRVLAALAVHGPDELASWA